MRKGGPPATSTLLGNGRAPHLVLPCLRPLDAPRSPRLLPNSAPPTQRSSPLQGRPLTPSHFPNDPGLWEEVLDLCPYINTSALIVPETFTIERSYILFSTLGLRHLVVVDDYNRVKVGVGGGWRVEGVWRTMAVCFACGDG